MKINTLLNKKWLDPHALQELYSSSPPFPHIVMEDFFAEGILDEIEQDFPDLAILGDKAINFKNSRETKYASNGMEALSSSAFNLVSILNSDYFLNYLAKVTGIKETLISDPYLSGGGYHEIKSGGFLKVHADFNKHPKLDLDRRLNLIIYLNKNWLDEWGGGLQLFDSEMSPACVSVVPKFNTAVLFTTTSSTFHGLPDPLNCPSDRSRRSLALYYFSIGRPASETIGIHSTLFKERKEDEFGIFFGIQSLMRDFLPPIVIRVCRKIFK